MSDATSSTDISDLEALYSQLRSSISAPRIERIAGRSHGKWHSERSLVQIVRKEGKFETFGRYIENKLYLEYYEALYLLELGRLQLCKDDLTLSIEQAYLLLLGENPTPKFNEYLVYSYMTRAGYILIGHRNKFFSQSFKLAPTEVDCIWAWLLNAVDEKRTVPSYIKKTEMFAKVKQQMELIKLKIMQPAANDPMESLEVCTATKKAKLENAEQQQESVEEEKPELWPIDEDKSFLTFLMSEPEFKQFEKLFQKFDVIKLKTSKSLRDACSNDSSDNDEMEIENNVQNLSINFDLYLHNNGFRKSAQMPPVMRVLILDSKQPFPSHTDISRCCQSLLHVTPLLIVSVGDAKQIQAFLYLFT